MKKEILLRSSWQDVNIGDIAHTPGMLAILEKRIPDAAVTVWVSENTSEQVLDIIGRRFNGVSFVKGTTESGEVRGAIDRADFFLHGSGPFLVGANELRQFLDKSEKPFGVMGITYCKEEKPLLDKAEFVYFRDTASFEKARADGVTAKHMAFGPDAAFAADIQDNMKCDKFLRETGLIPKKFLCCIPRLRVTPYWQIKKEAAYCPEADELNNRYKEQDHRYLRAAIIRVLEQTDYKVLICPEDQTQIAVGRELLLEKLPKKYREGVVLRQDFWMPDEAVSVYKNSLMLFGNEMHSPILCIGNGIPAIVCRWEQQTSKGQMWRDIGLEQWLFDSDKGIDDDAFAGAVMNILTNYREALKKSREAMNIVDGLYDKIMLKISELL